MRSLSIKDGDGIADGRLTATDKHPFWVDDEREWFDAIELEKEDHLLAPDGSRVTVLAVAAYGAVATVHNLTVEGIHTYYVRADEADVLVHNTNGGEPCDVGDGIAYPIPKGSSGGETARKKITAKMRQKYNFGVNKD
ncbi:polymorphic toxin-type HINT domain-containing protein [Haloechinothrix halophila]|uniref:polymorphic toxin-type HINT domain-containing protein n=1 Tax=Haloechinothrix halophila TaxID=1069073 RepID=UPI00041249FC|nr:polymorphic toxin-type HINT domain-containing protein [Haloechinothrix halophila]